MSVLIRSLSDLDLEAAARILSSAFERRGNWINNLKFNIQLQPDGYYGAFQDGVLAGMVGTTIYSAFAYVGLMGVDPDFQRRGIGLALMQHLLFWLDNKSISLVLLDASPFGQLLYQKLGFVACEPVYVFQRRKGEPIHHRPIETRLLNSQDLERISITDMHVFGADRSRLFTNLLEKYPNRAFVLQDGLGSIKGYIFAREASIGPWVMQEPEGAEPLLQAVLSLPFEGDVSVVVPGSNTNAISLLQRYGYKVIRTNLHMMRGSGVRCGQSERIFGQTSLSLG
jgi:ribosomal protein S18 acetylase RimI-like enzyme